MEYCAATRSKLSYYCGIAAIIGLLYLSIIKEVSADDSQNNDASTEFIKSSCGVTIYPKVCFESLVPYADYIQSSSVALANAALNATLKGAQSTLNNISRLSKGKHLSAGEAHAISDCVENLKDSVSELQESLIQLKDLDGPEFEGKMGNVMTWVSAALTDEDTCMDGFEESDDLNGKLKSSIRTSIVKVGQLTSNALAIIKSISAN